MSLQQRGRVRAPELNGGRSWLNTDKPLSLQALKGKVVLLDFWTYGCINCIHIIPDLKRLEAKYANQLVVIGVHSAKFENEKETDNIRQIILRYEIEHPVVNDADFAIWNNYAVRAWPTQVLVDPAGYVVGKAEGEGNYEELDKTIGKLVEEFGKRGELKEQPLQLALEQAKTGDLPLRFPGKVLADAKADRLFIADSNHNRIVITKLGGTLLDTIGTGAPGAIDGDYGQATFNRPQGMALGTTAQGGEVLYVADTENHLIRIVDLKGRIVSSLAGTGEQSQTRETRGPARDIALNSPWDLHTVGRTLYIAMAGPHQIWQLDLDEDQLSVFAGSGREARTDGTPSEAAFAQPSGLTSDSKTLYVADSESNIIRAIDLGLNGKVRTLAGGDLFVFGDRDGQGDNVRLQHPLGLVATSDGKVLIADTYNHKIKQLDSRAGIVKTFIGTGQPGQDDSNGGSGAASFYEPGGLSVAGSKLCVADTNNHAVRVVDLGTKQTATLKIKGLQSPIDNTSINNGATVLTPNAEEIKLSPQQLQVEADGTLIVDVTLPIGYHLNASAPNRYKVVVERGEEVLALATDNAQTAERTVKDLQLPLRIPLFTHLTGAAQLRVGLTLYYCREDNTGTCRIKTLVWHMPVEVTANAEATSLIKAEGQLKL